MRNHILWTSFVLIFAFCSPALALPEGVFTETIPVHVFDDYYSQVLAQFGPLNTSFAVDPLLAINATSRDALTDDAFAMLGIGLGDVTNFSSQDVYLDSLFDVQTSATYNPSDDFVFIGDLDDLENITVLNGTITLITTETTTEERHYELSLAGDLLDQSGGPDNPAPVPEPSTLFLFGGGLIGLFAKHRAGRPARP